LREEEFPDKVLTLRYQFVHALYQNALYGLLTPGRRASLSAAVAAGLLGHYNQYERMVASEVAFLLEAAREFAQAAQFFRLAAQNAAGKLAHHETVALARRGLAALEHSAETPERYRLELDLQLTLGPALGILRGFTAPGLEEAYERARVLSLRLGVTEAFFPALWHLCLSSLCRAHHKKAPY